GLHHGPGGALEPVDRRADSGLDAAPDGRDDLLAYLGLREEPDQARYESRDAGDDQTERVSGERGVERPLRHGSDTLTDRNGLHAGCVDLGRRPGDEHGAGRAVGYSDGAKLNGTVERN